ncbi:DMT family transporter [Aerobium aerolatum]|uniref:EamA-like transporter family protein n=1 Tax=Aquamicrobium aerolatum DSM 21857 TaxID=1121003 RepID=A0A1I3QFR1_9HYPH|nr:DMT family transporter [Aquamicrobium aerolatum]SFJ32788.1 EamA-like transporter family protein [Aquamicrobium aerolatum DSM 21857]
MSQTTATTVSTVIQDAPEQAPATLRGHLAMILFTALVSGSYSFGGLAAPHIAPGAVNAMRFAVGIGFMAAVVVVLYRGRIPAPSSSWRYLLLGGLMAVFFITMFMALGLTDPVSTGAVFTLMPLMSAIFGYFLLRQIPRPIVVASLVVAALGSIWVIFGGDLAAIRLFDIGRGEIIFFVGVICHALYSPLVKKLNDGREPLAVFTLYTMMGTGLCIAIYGAREVLETDWAALPPVVWLAIGYLAVFTSAGTTYLVQYGAMRLPAAKVMAYTYLSPCFIIVYEGMLGHGWPSFAVLAGVVVIVLGLLVMALSKDPQVSR